ncbi:hypothetical protein [Novipirellula sp.]|uniref:hypothetical protein n=1 Tax=Novipirellula sp. TaxID=2795430 RepID=UPI00356670D7
MPLTVFDHDNLAYYESVADPDGPHQLGGDPNDIGITFRRIKNVVHLIGVLSANDPVMSFIPKSLTKLPLCYGFRYASNGGDFLYVVESDTSVRILPDMTFSHAGILERIRWGGLTLLLRIAGLTKYDHGHQYTPDFPYAGHPDTFVQSRVRFERQPYDPENAEDAFKMQGVFGLKHLSDSEMQRATRLGLSNNSYVSDPELYNDMGWTDQEKVELLGRSPFYQTAPSTICDNPKCPSGRYESTAKIIALHEPDDDVVWGDAYVQMIYTLCSKCNCINVTNQCT